MVIEHGHLRCRPEQDSSDFLNPKIFCKPKVWETPREIDDQDLTMKVDMVKPSKRTKPHTPRGTFISKSQKKEGKRGQRAVGPVDQGKLSDDAIVGNAGEE